MQRFRKYMGQELNVESVRDEKQLESFGVKCTYLPDPVEEFDEFEFRTDFGGQDNIVITLTVELGKIQRIIFGEADADNPDVVRSLSQEKLNDFLAEKSEGIVSFFEFIT